MDRYEVKANLSRLEEIGRKVAALMEEAKELRKTTAEGLRDMGIIELVSSKEGGRKILVEGYIYTISTAVDASGKLVDYNITYEKPPVI